VAGARQAVREARRIVVKVGSSSLTTASGGLDADRVDALVDVLAKSRSGGEREIVLVSSGAIAAAAGIPVVLTSAVHAAEALSGGDTGTFFHPTGKRSADRLLWLQHASAPQGALTLDDGAVRAVVERRKSLLPAGIAAVEGEFSAGDPVELRDTTGRAVARGLVNFDAKEIPRLIGRSTHELARELGPEYEREVVHRDDLVLLHP
jgi:glutamate 5-kinase